MPVDTPTTDMLDRSAKRVVLIVQEYSLLAWSALRCLFSRPVYWEEMLEQADVIGAGSTPIVAIIGFFIGAVLALQSNNLLAAFGAQAYTGQFVGMTMLVELGPVLTGIVVSGRNASTMASQLGSMVVTEQIDAMRSLGFDPIRKLVAPRIAAAVVVLALLTLLADAVGIFGGGCMAVYLFHMDAEKYFVGTYSSFATMTFSREC
jgi:phospholipid/cholesterol/gamma-HCH transport system permease protein